jgi:hypothetical protein
MVSPAVANFVRQQGFSDVPEESCERQFEALNFQPRVIGPLVLAAILFQSAPIFLCLSAVLWWSALFPQLNPFNAIHNAFFAAPRRLPRLGPAPSPRRFSMGMAASFMLAAGAFMLAGFGVAAAVMQVLVAVAIVALLFGKLCLGSYVFHLLRGNAAFANRTLPWSPRHIES